MWAELILGLPRPRVVALVGGGGKTSLMCRLHEELSRAGFRAVMTSTTKLSADEPCGLLFAEAHNLAQAVRVLAAPVTSGRRTALVSGRVVGRPGKMKGIPAAWVDSLAQEFPDYVFLVEADGAAGFPLKGHMAHEPVIPASASMVIPVVGVDGLGKRPAEESVHRLGRFYELSGARAGEPITAETVAKVLLHREGYLRGMQTDARVVPFLNKVESFDGRMISVRLRQAVLGWRHPQVAGVMSGSVAEGRFEFEPADFSRVAGVILAAGESSRMGLPKQMLLLDGEPLVRVVAAEALRSRLGEVLVVTGSAQPEVEMGLAGLPVRMVANPQWKQGQSTSVAAGVQAMTRDMKAVMFLLGDQPLVIAGLINRLIAAYEQAPESIVAPRCGERQGNPVIFARNRWEEELTKLSGDEGARGIIRANSADVCQVDVGDEELFLDIDTPQDYERICLVWANRKTGLR